MWHWASGCCREKWVSQVHSAQAAIREKISESSSINYKSNKVAFSVNNKVYRVMLPIRYDPTSPVEDTSCASCQLSCNLLAINIVCLSPVEINKLRRVRGNFSFSCANVAILCHFRCRLSVICSTWKWYMLLTVCVCLII